METMLKKLIFAAFLIGLVPAFFIFSAQALFASTDSPAEIPKPIILSTTQLEEKTGSQIQINGLSTPGYNIIIYINGKYNGLANVSQINSSFSKFSYLSSLLDSDESFEVMAFSQDINSSQFSAPTSAMVNSIIEKSFLSSAQPNELIEPVAAANVAPPTLLTPNQSSCILNPYISGQSLNNGKIYIYIDDELFSTISVYSSSIQSSFFSYSPAVGLGRGKHYVYAIAQDANGNKSIKSNVLSFCINSPQILTATSSLADGLDNAVTSTGEISYTSPSNPVFQKTDNGNNVKNKQGNPLNILIFIIFIIGLFVWIFLVNQELRSELTENIEIDHKNDKQ
jgi:hypothetical protein